MDIRSSLRKFPFIAILRGIKTTEAYQAGLILKNAGFKIIEVPLNSPTPYDSIRILAESFGSEILVGAGTVLEVSQVDQVVKAGGKLIISPNCDPEVISYAKSAGLICLPGVATPTEAFNALKAGADGLKLFPTELVSPAAIKAMKAVLPQDTLMIPVGGINSENWKDFLTSGEIGFGLGSSLYKAGMSMIELQENAEKFVKT
jgi:2-dehydro-3-deoxyphosphogalactonate aldolase